MATAESLPQADQFSSLHEAWVTRPEKKSQLLNECNRWKSGVWTGKEVEILKRNITEFQKKYDLDDPATIIFDKDHKLRSEFFHSIACNIERPLFAVYRKVCRDYNAENYVHEWSDELTQQLRWLYSVHGNKWSVIGRTIGVSARAARDKYRQISGRGRIGDWELAEERRLVAAMKQLYGEDIVQNNAVLRNPSVTWDKVAELVETRNAIQCRTKWLYTDIADRIGERTKLRWGDLQDLDLLDQLCQQSATDEEEVDWMDISQHWDNLKTSYQLRGKWVCLKRRVPGYALKSFQENLDYLMEHFVPVIRQKLKDS